MCRCNLSKLLVVAVNEPVPGIRQLGDTGIPFRKNPA